MARLVAAPGPAGTALVGSWDLTGARVPHDRHNDSMSELKDRLRADLTTAMKSRDDLRASTIRMVLTALTNAEVAGKQARTLSDEEVIGVLSAENKKRREAAEAFEGAGRAESAAKERAEAAVIAEYLPAQLEPS